MPVRFPVLAILPHILVAAVLVSLLLVMVVVVVAIAVTVTYGAFFLYISLQVEYGARPHGGSSRCPNALFDLPSIKRFSFLPERAITNRYRWEPRREVSNPYSCVSLAL